MIHPKTHMSPEKSPHLLIPLCGCTWVSRELWVVSCKADKRIPSSTSNKVSLPKPVSIQILSNPKYSPIIIIIYQLYQIHLYILFLLVLAYIRYIPLVLHPRKTSQGPIHDPHLPYQPLPKVNSECSSSALILSMGSSCDIHGVVL